MVENNGQTKRPAIVTLTKRHGKHTEERGDCTYPTGKPIRPEWCYGVNVRDVMHHLNRGEDPFISIEDMYESEQSGIPALYGEFWSELLRKNGGKEFQTYGNAGPYSVPKRFFRIGFDAYVQLHHQEKQIHL